MAARDPYSTHVTRRRPGSLTARAAKSRAARNGPTVCELEGPTPMENSSNAETYALILRDYAAAKGRSRTTASRLWGMGIEAP
ncbi:hypothetical protein GCM10009806_02130 [Microbacterium flavum]